MARACTLVMSPRYVYAKYVLVFEHTGQPYHTQLTLPSQYIPSITEAALGRLTRESKTPELRTMCLQVVSDRCDDSVMPVSSFEHCNGLKERDTLPGAHANIRTTILMQPRD